MSKYLATNRNRPCPVCEKTNGNCRILPDDGVLCMTARDGYGMENHPEYRYVKLSKNGLWGVYYPRQEENDFDRERWLRERNARFEIREKEQAQRNQAALSIEDRDREIRSILNQLTLSDSDRAELHRRGFTDEEIEKRGFRSVKQWQALTGNLSYAVNRQGKLNNPTDGIIVPVVYFGQYVAFRLHDLQGRPKYRSFTGSHLKNGEFPIAVYGHEKAKGETWTTEGMEYKPQLTEIRFDVPVIGHNGSNFTSSPQQVKEALERLNTKIVVLCPDGGVTENRGLVKQYEEAIAFYRSLGYIVLIAWWGQFTKDDGDIDEVNPRFVEKITPEEFLSYCTGSKLTRFKDWLVKQSKRLKPKGFGKPTLEEAERTEYDPGDRVATWLELANQGGNVKDDSVTGSGKSHAVPQFAIEYLRENPGGKVFYVTTDHRNPTTPAIADNFVDLNPRNKYGFYRNAQGKLIKADKDTPREMIVSTSGHCPNADHFTELSQKGYDPNAGGSDNEICKICPHNNICSFTPGWYRHDRHKGLESSQIRCHSESLPREDFDYSQNALVFDDNQFTPSKTLETTWGGLLIELDRYRERLTPEHYQTLDNVLQSVKHLFNDKSKYGLAQDVVKQAFTLSSDLTSIIETLAATPLPLGEILKEPDTPDFNQLTREERKQYQGVIKTVKSFENSQAYLENKETLTNVPTNALIYLLKFLNGETGIVPRFINGTLQLTLDNRGGLAKILDSTKCNLFLNATQTEKDLALETGVNRPIKSIRAKQKRKHLSNVTVKQITVKGIASKKLSDKAISRVNAVLTTLREDCPDLGLIAPKAWLKLFDLDGYWFKDNRGSNDFIGRLNLALLGMPNPNLGAIQDKYLALTGSLDGFEEYYQTLVNQEILQGLGRPRANRYPDQQFTVYCLTPDNADLSWVTDYGAKLVKQSAFEITPDAGTEKQFTLNKIIDAIARLTGDGLKVTQDAIAQLMGLSRSGVCMALNRLGITTDWIMDRLEKLLATRPNEDLIGASGQNWGRYQEFRELFDLEPMAMIAALVDTVKSEGMAKLDELLEYFPEALRGQALGYFWALLTPETDPPPLNPVT